MKLKSVEGIKLLTYSGMTLGVSGWLIGVLIISARNSQWSLIKEVFWPGFFLSITMAFVVVLVMEGISRTFGPRNTIFITTLMGMIFFFMGTLIFFINHLVAPKILENPMLNEKLLNSGVVFETSDTLGTILLAVAAIPLGSAALRMIFAEHKDLLK